MPRKYTIKCVKETTWRSKYDPVFKNVIKAPKNKSEATINGSVLCRIASKQWQKGKPIRRLTRLALHRLLRSLVQEEKFESIWLPPAITDKYLVSTKRGIGCLLITIPKLLN